LLFEIYISLLIHRVSFQVTSIEVTTQARTRCTHTCNTSYTRARCARARAHACAKSYALGILCASSERSLQRKQLVISMLVWRTTLLPRLVCNPSYERGLTIALKREILYTRRPRLALTLLVAAVAAATDMSGHRIVVGIGAILRTSDSSRT